MFPLRCHLANRDVLSISVESYRTCLSWPSARQACLNEISSTWPLLFTVVHRCSADNSAANGSKWTPTFWKYFKEDCFLLRNFESYPHFICRFVPKFAPTAVEELGIQYYPHLICDIAAKLALKAVEETSIPAKKCHIPSHLQLFLMY